MSEPVKRRTGRPRKSGAEKVEQFSIRLNPNRKLELSLIARARNESLAQAVDYLIAEASESFTIDGESVKTHVTEGLYKIFTAYAAIAPDKSSISVEALWDIVNKNPGSNLALLSPASLLSEDELYFRELLALMAKTEEGRKLAWKLAAGGHLDVFISVATNARLVGITPDKLTRLKPGSTEAHVLLSETLRGMIKDMEELKAEIAEEIKKKEKK